MARAPYGARTPHRARNGSVPRGNLFPLCDTPFAEAVAPAPDAGADDMSEGHEGTETPGWHLTQETADTPQRCGSGDEVTHARGIDPNLWCCKVEPTPVGAQGGRMSIPRVAAGEHKCSLLH